MLAPDHVKAENAREFKYRKINRLILIGNGFDLAHGLKSSFKDFIEDYFFEILLSLKDLGSYEDPLISLSFNRIARGSLGNLRSPSEIDVFGIFLRVLKDERVIKKKYTTFLKSITSDLNVKKWVDIELIYFELLKQSSKSVIKNVIEDLNAEMDFLKVKLMEYLQKEVSKHSFNPDINLLYQFSEDIRESDVQPKTLKENKNVGDICFLNFNYTNFPKKYIHQMFDQNCTYIPIHGQLNGDNLTSQGPVFGYGDELDEDYLKFENLNKDQLFDHIKSFKYLHFGHYRNLLDFIERNPFQVYIYGHSCGLSDRTLLNTIFENENCISIKNFYYQSDGKDDYTQRSYAIARHFKNKADLRSKVVSKEKCQPMIQV